MLEGLIDPKTGEKKIPKGHAEKMMRKYLKVKNFPKERFFDPRIDIPLSEDLNISNKDELFECLDSFSNSSLEPIP